jgi:hypothetical protein
MWCAIERLSQVPAQGSRKDVLLISDSNQAQVVEISREPWRAAEGRVEQTEYI